jgi:excisionase family DNA binding protein
MFIKSQPERSPVAAELTEAPTSRQAGGDRADPILTIQEAAADLSVSRRTIYDWVHKGIIEPPQKLGLRRVGYLRSTIERFKASRPPAFQPVGR